MIRTTVVASALWALAAAGCAQHPTSDVPPRSAAKAKTPATPKVSGAELEKRRRRARTRAENRRIVEADRLGRDGKHEEAARVLESVVADAPARTDALLRLGNTRLYLDDVQGAILAFETAYDLGAKAPKLPLSIAELWLRLGDLDVGLDWLRRAQEASPDDSALRLRMAQVLLVDGRLDEASELGSALLLDERPEIVQAAHVLLGYAAMSRGDEEQAATHWEAAAKRPLARQDILSYLGQKQYLEEHYAEAARYFSAYLDVAADESVHRRLVFSLVRSKQLPEARAEILKYLERYPESEYRADIATAAASRP